VETVAPLMAGTALATAGADDGWVGSAADASRAVPDKAMERVRAIALDKCMGTHSQ